MIEELQKRPFVRPLLLWIAGIILQVCFPLSELSVWLLLPVAIVVVISFCFSGKQSAPVYSFRWLWGVLISCVIIFMSIRTTDYMETHDPPKAERLMQKARETQTYLAHKLDNLQLSDNEKSILATITISYRQTLPRETRRQFSTVGVAHILAVSGFHVGIVYGALLLALSFLPRRRGFGYLKTALIFLGIWTFAFIAGLGVSTVRATIMISIYLVGKAFGRRPERYNTLAAAAFILLVYNPYNLFDIGFQLSFTAVFFIFLIQRPLSNLIPVRNPLLKTPWDILTVTTAAQTGVMFLCCYYFGTFTTVFLIANLVLSLIATALIPLGLLWMLLPAGLPYVAPLQWLVETLMHGFMWFISRLFLIPWASLPIRFDWVTTICAYISLLTLIRFFYNRRARTLIISLSVLLATIIWGMF